MSSQKILKYNHEILLTDTTYKTNKYKMLLIIVSRVTSLNISYYIAFAFVFKKIFKIYKWLFECIGNLYKYFDILNLDVIFTNAQNKLIQAITIVYLLVSYLFCFWYINKNVIIHYKKWFDNKT